MFRGLPKRLGGLSIFLQLLLKKILDLILVKCFYIRRTGLSHPLP